MTPFKIDPEFQNANRRHTRQERENLRAMLTQDGCNPGALTCARLDGELYLIDGHTTWELCEEEGLPVPEPLIISFSNREEILDWIHVRSRARRNLSPEEMAQRRGERIERSAEARSQGKSTRAIAEAEGVSQTQVRKDLKAAGEHGCSPEPKDGKATGKDGKSYPAIAAKSIFCERCQRVGPIKDCPACAGLSKFHKSPNKPTKSGKPLFDWREFEKHFGHVVRSMDALKKAYNLVPDDSHGKHFSEELAAFMKVRVETTDEFSLCMALLAEFLNVWERWRRRVLRIKQGSGGESDE